MILCVQPIAQGVNLMSDVTIYTLAKELNMTPSMISRAFNPNARISDDKRRVILETAKKYGYTPNKFASRLSMKTVRIGVLINSRFDVNTEKMISGVKNAYEKLKDYKIQYDITVVNSGEKKPRDYSNTLKKYRDFDGVILSGMSSKKYTGIINEFYSYNPKVVQVQAINKSADYLFASKHNDETASYLAAEFLCNCLGKSERKNILLFTGDRESVLHKDSELNFKAACGTMGLNILDSIDMKDDEEYFEKIISEIFIKYADKTDGIYITSGISKPLCNYIYENKIKLPLVCFDTHKDIKLFMEKGVISATIAQNVEHQMESAFESLVMHLIRGHKYPKCIYTDVQLVLKSNIHQYR